MNQLIHADIFFFVATISLILISIGIVTAFIYAIGILKNVRDITDKAKQEWDEIIIDSQKLRSALRDEGMKWKHIVDVVRAFFMRGKDKPEKKPINKIDKKIKNDKKNFFQKE